MIDLINLVVAILCTSAATPSPAWISLADPVRITYYGPEYRGGELSASGIRYAPDASIVALGPVLLAKVRRHYAAEARAQGQPLWWRWMPGPRLKFQGIAGGYPRHACFDPTGLRCEPAWWGYLVRVCDVKHCELLRVADTGTDALQADLPDRTWERFGHLASQGAFTGTLEVLTWAGP